MWRRPEHRSEWTARSQYGLAWKVRRREERELDMNSIYKKYCWMSLDENILRSRVTAYRNCACDWTNIHNIQMQNKGRCIVIWLGRGFLQWIGQHCAGCRFQMFGTTSNSFADTGGFRRTIVPQWFPVVMFDSNVQPEQQCWYILNKVKAKKSSIAGDTHIRNVCTTCYVAMAHIIREACLSSWPLASFVH